MYVTKKTKSSLLISQLLPITVLNTYGSTMVRTLRHHHSAAKWNTSISYSAGFVAMLAQLSNKCITATGLFKHGSD